MNEQLFSDFRVTVFMAANPPADLQFSEAINIASEIINRHANVFIYGGGSIGLMGSVAQRMTKPKIEAHSMPQYAADRYASIPYSLYIDHSNVGDRVNAMINTDLIVGLPGGLGTIHEMLQSEEDFLNRHCAPIVIYNAEGLNQILVNLLHNVVDEGWANKSRLERVNIISKPETLEDFVQWAKEIAPERKTLWRKYQIIRHKMIKLRTNLPLDVAAYTQIQQNEADLKQQLKDLLHYPGNLG